MSQSSSQELEKFLGLIEPTHSFKQIECLVFHNSEYKKGDNISIRDTQDKFGKILFIAKSPFSTFPILLVAWYYNYKQTCIDFKLGRRQLLLTEQKDWQYIESVKNKINVLTAKQYALIDWNQKQNMFYCKGYLKNGIIIYFQNKQTICHCKATYDGQSIISKCLLCGFIMHPLCTQSDDLCLICQ